MFEMGTPYKLLSVKEAVPYCTKVLLSEFIAADNFHCFNRERRILLVDCREGNK